MVAAESKPAFLFVTVLLVTAYWLVGKAAWPGWLLILLLLWLYRDPERRIPAAPYGVISPADAKVTVIEKKVDPVLKQPMVCIRLRLRWFGVLRLRSPSEGKITHYGFLKPDASRFGNKCMGVAIKTDEQDEVVVTVNTRTWLRRIHCYVRMGARIGQGRRCGFLSYGSVLEVFVPPTARILVKPGQQVEAGMDLLAEFNHS